MSNKKEEQKLAIDKITAAVQPEIVYDGGTSPLSKDVYISTLPDHLSAKIVRDVREHDANYILGVRQAHGLNSIEKFVDDKSLDKLVLKADMINSDYKSTVSRSRETRNPTTGEKSVKFLPITDNYTFRGTGKNGLAGDLRNELSEKAAKLLAD